MALSGAAAKSLLSSLLAPRLLQQRDALNKLSAGLHTLVSSGSGDGQAQSAPATTAKDTRQQQQQQQARPSSPHIAYGLAASAAMTPAGQRLVASGMPMLPKRNLLGMQAIAGSKAPLMPHQRRHMNSWSTVQRYFVEGDHVVQSEVNRTFQFTGLDSGSFYPFVVYTTIATIISAVFMVVPWVIAPQRVDLDKASAYECGFDAFGEARQTFSVSFYLVSIMYLLFDIEICYLFPYVMCHANAQMFWTMNLFLSLLVVGFVYEWGVGALEWRS